MSGETIVKHIHLSVTSKDIERKDRTGKTHEEIYRLGLEKAEGNEKE